MLRRKRGERPRRGAVGVMCRNKAGVRDLSVAHRTSIGRHGAKWPPGQLPASRVRSVNGLGTSKESCS